jgi:hypothetical protein
MVNRPHGGRVQKTVVMMVLTVALSGAAACEGAGRDDAVVTRDSAGIVVVRNTRPSRDTVRLSAPAIRIGDDEAKTESVFREVHDVAFTGSGNIVVVDRGTRVVLFDSAGGSPRPIGREGSGPGEYRAIRWALTRGDTIALWDVGQRRMHHFSESGESVGSLAMSDNGEGRMILPIADGWLDEGETGQYADTLPARGFILRRGADGAIRDTVVPRYPIPEINMQVIDPKTGYRAMVNPPALSIPPAWTAEGRRIVWASATQPRIHVLSADGKVERIIELPYAASPTTDQHRDAFVATLADRYGFSAEAAAKTRATTTFTDTLPTITRVLLDDEGSIWAAGFTATEPFSFVGPAWDVLDDEGRILRRVEFPARFVLHAVRNGRALGIRTLESGVSAVEVYYVP